MADETRQLNQVQGSIDGTSVERVAIGADDIMELLKSSLSEGGPFATEFTQRVIKPLAKKIESKLYVSAVEVDGANLGEYINDTLKSQSQDAIDSSANTLSKQLGDLDISKSVEDLNSSLKPVFDLTNFNLSDILISQADDADQSKIKKIRKAFMGSLEVNISQAVKDMKLNTTFNLSSLFGSEPKALSLLTWRKYHKLRTTLMGSLTKHIDSIVKSASESGDTLKNGIPLSSLLGKPDGPSDPFTWFAYKKAQFKLLNALSKNIDGLVEKATSGEISLDLSSLLGAPPSQDPVTWIQFKLLQYKLLKKIRSKIDDISAIESEDFLPEDDNKLLNKVDEEEDKSDNEEKSSKKPPKFKSLIEKKDEIIIGGFSKPALASLAAIMPAVGEAVNAADGAEKAGALISKGMISKIKSALPWVAGAGLLLGGLAALVGGIATSGPAKGILKMIGKGGLAGGLKLIGMKLGKVLIAKGLKRIPVIGGLISLAFAISRFRKGDIIGGVIDLVSGIVGLVDLVAPGVGTMLSLGVDALNAILDAKTGGASKEANAKKIDIFKMIGSKIWTGIKKSVRYLPGIGSIIRIGESFKEIKDGKIVEGLLSFASAISVGVPGAGTAIAAVIDIFKSKQEEKAASLEGTGQKTFTQNINSWIIEKFKKTSLYKFSTYLGQILRGDIKNGLLGMVGMIGGLPVIGKPLQRFAGWLIDKTEEPVTMAFEKTKSLFSVLRDTLKDKIIKKFKKAPKWMQWIMKRVPGFKGLLAKENDVDIEDSDDISDAVIDTGEKNKTAAYYKRMRLEKEASERRAQGLPDIDPNTAWEAGSYENAAKSFDNGSQMQATPNDSFDQTLTKLPPETPQPINVTVQPDKSNNNKAQIDSLNKEVRNLSQMIADLANAQSKEKVTLTDQGNQASLPPIETSDRDPAFDLRANVWGRLRTGHLLA